LKKPIVVSQHREKEEAHSTNKPGPPAG
jgi:hypothetical protein